MTFGGHQGATLEEDAAVERDLKQIPALQRHLWGGNGRSRAEEEILVLRAQAQDFGTERYRGLGKRPLILGLNVGARNLNELRGAEESLVIRIAAAEVVVERSRERLGGARRRRRGVAREFAGDLGGVRSVLAKRPGVVGRRAGEPVLVDGLADPSVPFVGGREIEVDARLVGGEGEGLGEGHLGFAEAIQLEVDEAEVEQDGRVVGRARREFPEDFLGPLQPPLLEVQHAEEAQDGDVARLEQVGLGEILLGQFRLAFRQVRARPLDVRLEQSGGERGDGRHVFLGEAANGPERRSIRRR